MSDETEPTPTCAYCGAVATTRESPDTFTYGAGPDAVELTALVRWTDCRACGFSAYGVGAALARTDAVCRHLQGVVRELRGERDRAVEAVHTHVREGAEMCRRHEAELAAACQEARAQALEECCAIAMRIGCNPLNHDILRAGAHRVEKLIVGLMSPTPAAPLPPTEPTFIRGSDPANETCLGCGRHIRRHYGGTEYRCYPRPDPEPEPEPPTFTAADVSRAVAEAVAREREACAEIAAQYEHRFHWHSYVSDAIRARTTPATPPGTASEGEE